jgi:flagellar export protein FliJ
MQAFKFRLQRVLEYRELQEGWAKDAYREARSQLSQAEAELAQLFKRQAGAQAVPTETLDQRLTLDQYLKRVEDEIAAQQTVIDILSAEEEKAKNEWLEAKRNCEAMAKLRETAEALWQSEADAEEQKELDDWATTRRAA